jgi:hypothetical protein
MRQSPSIIPTDRLDRDIYLVLEDFRAGAAWRETDEGETDVSTIVEDLLTGQYEQPLRVVAFNPAEGWSRDATEEIAEELERRIAAGARFPRRCRSSSRAISAERSACSWHCRCAASEWGHARLSKVQSVDQRMRLECGVGFVWTAPGWQEKSSRISIGRCGHVFGL